MTKPPRASRLPSRRAEPLATRTLASPSEGMLRALNQEGDRQDGALREIAARCDRIDACIRESPTLRRIATIMSARGDAEAKRVLAGANHAGA